MFAILLLLPLIAVTTAAESYHSPITITRGGTYSGDWQSLHPDVPAVRIKTTQPVTIKSSTVRGKGDLIRADAGPVDVTVEDTMGIGLNPNRPGKAKGRFFRAEGFRNVSLRGNYLKGTAGIYLLKYGGNGSPDQTVKILRNKVENIDGRKSTGSGFSTRDFDLVQFVQLDKVRNLSSAEIAWNEVVNRPGNSRVEDNINVYLSGGKTSSPLRIHNNYIKGAYPAWTMSENYSGGGILLGDGSSGRSEEVSSHVVAHSNHVIDTTNYGIAIANGHDIEARNNRVFSNGRFDDGRPVPAQNVGIYIQDSYNGRALGVFYNNTAYDNISCWTNLKTRYAWNGYRNDYSFPLDAAYYAKNVSLPKRASCEEAEARELTLWRNKLAANDVVVGPR